MKAILGAAFAALMFATSAMAQTPPAATPTFTETQIKTTDLGHGTYMLVGLGGNMTFAVGKECVLLVDTEFSPMHDKIKAAIAAVTPLPIKYVVNTHYHGDHTGGNVLFAQDGAILVGQTNLKKRLAEGVVNVVTGSKTPPASAAALPTMTYEDELTLKLGGRKAKLKHIANAHTDGDTYVYFPDANVIATGDIVSVGARYPNIDISVGGNINGMIAGAEEYLKLANADTKIVPGHGPLMSRADLEAYHTILVAARAAVAAEIAAGLNETDTIAAKPLAALDVKAGATELASANFVRLIYRSLKPAAG